MAPGDGHRARLRRFLLDVHIHTPFVRLVLTLASAWLVFASALFLLERREVASEIDSLGRALYWGIAAFSTAGIAPVPVSPWGKAVGGLWIILGSVLFFGTVVATVTAWFMRPLQRPARQIVDTIEYNLERLDDLSVEELELLRRTTDGLIEEVERQARAREAVVNPTPGPG